MSSDLCSVHKGDLRLKQREGGATDRMELERNTNIVMGRLCKKLIWKIECRESWEKGTETAKKADNLTLKTSGAKKT